ncbi:MAG: PQQ-binding-like beta-propeller repeat protein [Pirellulales bacterium]
MRARQWLVVALWLLETHAAWGQSQRDWLQWRGPENTGIAPGSKPPIEWSDSKNIAWKAPIPGKGHSTPLVVGDAVYVTTAIPIGPKLEPKMSGRPGEHDNLPVTSRQRFELLALDRTHGKQLWQRALHEAVPVEGGHYTASLASSSPVSDGKLIFVHLGSFGTYAVDAARGEIVWSKILGQMHTKHGHGEGASPALDGDTLIINWDHEEESFLLALNKRTGQVLWRQPRREDTSWSSPIIVDCDGKKQVIVCGTNRVRGYDLFDGTVLWECGGMSSNIVATPVYRDGIVYVGSSYEKRVLMAISIQGAHGDITDSSRVLWTRTRGTPYVPSMLLYDDSLYFLAHYQNVLSRISGPSGKDVPGAIRLGSLGDIYSSPVGANGYVYITDLHGTTEVIQHADLPRTVAVNRLDDRVAAGLAIAGDQIFIRGESFLYCISE